MMEQLLNQLVSEISEICPNVDLIQLRAKITGILAMYEIKPVVIASGHPDITEKVRMFLSAKKLEGLSKNTLAGYEIELRIFANYVQKPVDEITTADIRNFLGQFDNLKLSSISKNYLY